VSVRAQTTSKHLIEVRLRPEYADAEGAAALALLHAQGQSTLREARVSRLYEICGPLSATQAQQVAKELLCDSVTQEYRLLAPVPAPMNGMNFWRVEVWLKPTVADPAGDTVREAMVEAGMPRPDAVRTALAYRVSGRSSRPALEKAVWRSLANPLIHSVVVSEAHP
jgi:phosphoribosylformylglycinamidine (FGAM) synthase PurS component